MSKEFDSFTESDGGEFFESIGLERGAPLTLVWIGMVWIDEGFDSGYLRQDLAEGLELWNAASSQWNSLLDQNMSARAFVGVVHVANTVGGGRHSLIRPRAGAGVAEPNNVSIFKVGRPPTLEENLFVLDNAVINTRTPSRGCFIRDDSGSLKPEQVEPGYSEFIAALPSAAPLLRINLTQKTFVSELWLDEMVVCFAEALA